MPAVGTPCSDLFSLGTSEPECDAGSWRHSRKTQAANSSPECTTFRQSFHAVEHRPRVRVLFASDGARLELPFERNLWEPQRDRTDTGALENVLAPVDPADYNLDPLAFLEG